MEEYVSLQLSDVNTIKSQGAEYSKNRPRVVDTDTRPGNAGHHLVWPTNEDQCALWHSRHTVTHPGKEVRQSRGVRSIRQHRRYVLPPYASTVYRDGHAKRFGLIA